MKNKIEINMASSGVDVCVVEKKIENGMGNENWYEETWENGG